MRNFITLDLSRYSDISIQHNDSNVLTHQSQFVYCSPGINILTVHNHSPLDLEINEVLMFDIGIKKLKFVGQIHKDNNFWQGTVVPNGGIWKLAYEAPVFRWLHQTLEFGTLVTPTTYTKTVDMGRISV